MSSPELVDHQLLGHFEKQIESGTWATTYLFTGKELARKKELEIAFARALNCSQKPFSVSCSCLACKKIEAGIHPDVKWYGVDEELNSNKIADGRDFKNLPKFKHF